MTRTANTAAVVSSTRRTFANIAAGICLAFFAAKALYYRDLVSVFYAGVAVAIVVAETYVFFDGRITWEILRQRILGAAAGAALSSFFLVSPDWATGYWVNATTAKTTMSPSITIMIVPFVEDVYFVPKQLDVSARAAFTVNNKHYWCSFATVGIEVDRQHPGAEALLLMAAKSYGGPARTIQWALENTLEYKAPNLLQNDFPVIVLVGPHDFNFERAVVDEVRKVVEHYGLRWNYPLITTDCHAD